MIRSKLWLLLLFMPVFFVLAGCSSAESTTAPTEPVAFRLVATDIAFDSTQLQVEAGRSVQVTLENQGILEHDFSIMEIPTSGEITASEEADGHDMGHVAEDPDVHVAAHAGDSNTIEFTPAAAGEYTYYCTVPGHREAGMVGTLTVTAP